MHFVGRIYQGFISSTSWCVLCQSMKLVKNCESWYAQTRLCDVPVYGNVRWILYCNGSHNGQPCGSFLVDIWSVSNYIENQIILAHPGWICWHHNINRKTSTWFSIIKAICKDHLYNLHFMPFPCFLLRSITSCYFLWRHYV